MGVQFANTLVTLAGPVFGCLRAGFFAQHSHVLGLPTPGRERSLPQFFRCSKARLNPDPLKFPSDAHQVQAYRGGLHAEPCQNGVPFSAPPPPPKNRYPQESRPRSHPNKVPTSAGVWQMEMPVANESFQVSQAVTEDSESAFVLSGPGIFYVFFGWIWTFHATSFQWGGDREFCGARLASSSSWFLLASLQMQTILDGRGPWF